MKLATFNVNSILRRQRPFLTWLDQEAPDVVCLQELKADDASFPIAELRKRGYEARWQGQRSWNGVAIAARGTMPIETRRGLPGDPSDDQSRYLEAAVNGVLIGCLYLPNGNPQPGPKFAYKLAWFERFLTHAQGLWNSGHPVALIGDYNVVPTDFDIYNPRSWTKNALLRPEARACFSRLLGQGWTDALRTLFPDRPMFTFWDYFRDHRKRNAGLRLDHFLLSASLAPRLTDAGVDEWARDLPEASDHAPAWITLDLAAAPKAKKDETKRDETKKEETKKTSRRTKR